MPTYFSRSALQANCSRERFGVQIVAGGNLIAGLEHRMHAGVRDLYRALQHGHARALDSGIDREHRSGHGDAAIGSLHIQMTGGALRRLHDDVAAIEGNGHVAAACTHFKGAALVYLDGRAVRQAKDGVRGARGSQAISLAQRGAGGKLAIARGGDDVGRAVDRLHLGAHTGRNLPVGLVEKCDAQQEGDRESQRPAQVTGGPDGGSLPNRCSRCGPIDLCRL